MNDPGESDGNLVPRALTTAHAVRAYDHATIADRLLASATGDACGYLLVLPTVVEAILARIDCSRDWNKLGAAGWTEFDR